MEVIESLEDFYRRKLIWMPDNLKKEMGHFNIFRIKGFMTQETHSMPYSRKDYFKITMLTGHYRMHYADNNIEIDQPALIFCSPLIPYRWEPLGEQSGFFCIFTEAFFKQFGNIIEYPLFQPGGTPVFFPSEQQIADIEGIYGQMLEEIGSDYVYKYDLIRNLVFELIHIALKMQPASASIFSSSNAAIRISSLFMELLERQFPIESPLQQLPLQSPSQFAARLSIHVNHLNRSIRETTGKTTSRVIAERITQEARFMLMHTNWNIGEIAWCLGFEEPSHFINFFKKNADRSPGAFRNNHSI